MPLGNCLPRAQCRMGLYHPPAIPAEPSQRATPVGSAGRWRALNVPHVPLTLSISVESPGEL